MAISCTCGISWQQAPPSGILDAVRMDIHACPKGKHSDFGGWQPSTRSPGSLRFTRCSTWLGFRVSVCAVADTFPPLRASASASTSDSIRSQLTPTSSNWSTRASWVSAGAASACFMDEDRPILDALQTVMGDADFLAPCLVTGQCTDGSPSRRASTRNNADAIRPTTKAAPTFQPATTAVASATTSSAPRRSTTREASTS